jgi:hypothetical protein
MNVVNGTFRKPDWDLSQSFHGHRRIGNEGKTVISTARAVVPLFLQLLGRAKVGKDLRDRWEEPFHERL